MNKIETKKTFLGSTAGFWLKHASIIRKQSGDYVVCIKRWDAILTDDDCLLLVDEMGTPWTCLTLSDRALEKFKVLTDKADKLTMGSNK